MKHEFIIIKKNKKLYIKCNHFEHTLKKCKNNVLLT